MKKVCLLAALAFTVLLLAPFGVSAAEIGQDYFLTFSASEELYAGQTKLTENERNALFQELADLVKEYENTVSPSVTGSDIYALNAAQSEAAVEVSPLTASLLVRAEQLRLATGGAFDYRCGELVRLWGFAAGENYSVSRKSPPEQEISAALSALSGTSLSVSGQSAVRSGVALLDFGGVAKGHLADLLAQKLSEKGITDGNFSLMSNHFLLGQKKTTDGARNWRVGIKDPRNPTVECLTFEVRDKHVATSGDYERYYVYGGKRYCHIIDAATGAPADKGVMSVTVVGDSGALCDAVATAAFSWGAKKTLSRAEQLGVQVVVLCTDYKYYASEDLAVKPSSEVYVGYPACAYEKGENALAPDVAIACALERALYQKKSHLTEWLIGGVAIAAAAALVVGLAVKRK